MDTPFPSLCLSLQWFVNEILQYQTPYMSINQSLRYLTMQKSLVYKMKRNKAHVTFFECQPIDCHITFTPRPSAAW